MKREVKIRDPAVVDYMSNLINKQFRLIKPNTGLPLLHFVALDYDFVPHNKPEPKKDTPNTSMV